MRDPRVAVGIPIYGSVPGYVYFRHLQWFLQCYLQTREVHGILGSENCYLPWARRDIANDAIKDGFTHLFFQDQDVIVPAGTIHKLLAHRKPVVGALYYQKIQGHAPVAGNFNDTDLGWAPLEIKSPLQKVDMVGMGATLIEVEVFRALESVYQADLTALDTELSRAPEIARLLDRMRLLPSNKPDERTGMGWFDMNARTGEDIEFCRRIKAAGFQVWVDTSIETVHVGATPVSRKYYEWERSARDLVDAVVVAVEGRSA